MLCYLSAFTTISFAGDFINFFYVRFLGCSTRFDCIKIREAYDRSANRLGRPPLDQRMQSLLIGEPQFLQLCLSLFSEDMSNAPLGTFTEASDDAKVICTAGVWAEELAYRKYDRSAMVAAGEGARLQGFDEEVQVLGRAQGGSEVVYSPSSDGSGGGVENQLPATTFTSKFSSEYSSISSNSPTKALFPPRDEDECKDAGCSTHTNIPLETQLAIDETVMRKDGEMKFVTRSEIPHILAAAASGATIDVDSLDAAQTELPTLRARVDAVNEDVEQLKTIYFSMARQLCETEAWVGLLKSHISCLTAFNEARGRSAASSPTRRSSLRL